MATQGQLKGKVAIVTGGSAGIGRAIVGLFIEQGAKVASLDISFSAQGAAAAGENAASNELQIKCDVSSESDVDAAVNNVLQHWSALDILVNCAGVMDDFARSGEVTNAIWKRCFAINVDGPMLLIRRCLPELLKTNPKGAIVNICSTAAVRGAAAGVAYTASKHALLGLTRSTAWAYAKDGLRCNAVMPGGVGDTAIMAGTDPKVFQSPGCVVTAPYQACMPGMCRPADIAGAVLFLAAAVPAVNGAELSVDCGWTIA